MIAEEVTYLRMETEDLSVCPPFAETHFLFVGDSATTQGELEGIEQSAVFQFGGFVFQVDGAGQLV